MPMRSTFMLGLPAYDRALRYMGAGQLWQDQHRCAGDDVLSAEMLVGGTFGAIVRDMGR